MLHHNIFYFLSIPQVCTLCRQSIHRCFYDLFRARLAIFTANSIIKKSAKQTVKLLVVFFYISKNPRYVNVVLGKYTLFGKSIPLIVLCYKRLQISQKGYRFPKTSLTVHNVVLMMVIVVLITTRYTWAFLANLWVKIDENSN